MTVAIKNWFLEKQGFGYEAIQMLKKSGVTVRKETAKAVLVSYRLEGCWNSDSMWVPKSCLIDEWENTYSPKAIGGAYHEYLVTVTREAYKAGKLWTQRTFRSGRNQYNGASFVHQETTKELMETLNKYGVEYMAKDEFAKTLN